MRNILILAPMALVLAACASTPTEIYERRAFEEQQRQQEFRDRAVAAVPEWCKSIPRSNTAVFACGEGESSSLAHAVTKAKNSAYGEICMAAGGTVDKDARTFHMDTGSTDVESSQSAIRSTCKDVDITGVENVSQINGEPGTKIITSARGYRAFVLVALPTGDANPMQSRKDKLRLTEAARRAEEQAFREMEQRKQSQQNKQ
jgi:hypothetical protein